MAKGRRESIEQVVPSVAMVDAERQPPAQRMAEMLGTQDAALQAERVQNLINIASAPSYSVTVTLNSATGLVHGVSSTLSLDASLLVRAMATGQQWLLDRVAEAERQKASEAKPAVAALESHAD